MRKEHDDMIDSFSKILQFTFLIMTILLFSANGQAQEKAKLIYVGDPLCSWCYGFSGEISAALEELDAEVDFELIMGGLRPYNKETTKDLGDFLHHHWDQVSQRSGKNFKYDILKDSSFVYDTEPPSRAVLVVREIAAEKEFDFFKDVQVEFYLNNKNTNKIDAYFKLLEKYDLDKGTFTEAYNSERMKEKIKIDFRRASALGVRGFPSVLLAYKGETRAICNGYTNSEAVVKATRSIIRELDGK